MYNTTPDTLRHHLQPSHQTPTYPLTPNSILSLEPPLRLNLQPFFAAYYAVVEQNFNDLKKLSEFGWKIMSRRMENREYFQQCGRSKREIARRIAEWRVKKKISCARAGKQYRWYCNNGNRRRDSASWLLTAHSIQSPLHSKWMRFFCKLCGLAALEKSPTPVAYTTGTYS